MVSPELPAVPPGEQPRPLEGQFRHRHPVAVVGVVENGLVPPYGNDIQQSPL